MRSILLACGVLAAGPALAEDLVFTLVNNSSHAIVEMNVSSVDEENWGENILMVDAIAPGTQGEVTIADDEDAGPVRDQYLSRQRLTGT